MPNPCACENFKFDIGELGKVGNSPNNVIKMAQAFEFIFSFTQYVIRQMQWEYKKGFDLLDGAIEKAFPITITASVQHRPDISSSVTFNLILKNPCVNANRFSFLAANLLDKQYRILDPMLTWNHDKFRTMTTPVLHPYCGTEGYIATFNGEKVTMDSSPMMYDEKLR